MANKYLGEVSIRLDKVRVLRFTIDSMADFEERTGIGIDTVFRRAGEASDAKALAGEKGAAFLDAMGHANLRNLLWAALLHEEESLTPKEAGKLMTFADGETPVHQYGYILRGLIDAWWLSRGTSREEVEANALKAAEEAAKKRADIEPRGAPSAMSTPSTGAATPSSLASTDSTPTS